MEAAQPVQEAMKCYRYIAPLHLSSLHFLSFSRILITWPEWRFVTCRRQWKEIDCISQHFFFSSISGLFLDSDWFLSWRERFLFRYIRKAFWLKCTDCFGIHVLTNYIYCALWLMQKRGLRGGKKISSLQIHWKISEYIWSASLWMWKNEMSELKDSM